MADLNAFISVYVFASEITFRSLRHRSVTRDTFMQVTNDMENECIFDKQWLICFNNDPLCIISLRSVSAIGK